MTLTVCEIFIAFKPLAMNEANLGQYGEYFWTDLAFSLSD